MTESDWWACQEPQKMLEFLLDSGRASERKFRLFAVACCRRIWQIMTEDVNRQAVEVAERFADGEVNERKLGMASDEAGRAASATYVTAFDAARRARQHPAAAAMHACHSLVAALAASDPERVDPAKAAGNSVAALAEDCQNEERVAQTAFLRCIFGPLPFRTPSLEPALRTPTVLSLADAAYSERIAPDPSRPGWLVIDPARLLVLADALEEAGCDDADILAHYRTPGEHVRGCWCLDLLLAKEATPSPGALPAGPGGQREKQVRFRPSRAEGLPDVREVVVHPDRLEVNTAGSWVTFLFKRIGQRQESRVVSLAKRLVGRATWPVLVADRDWFHPPRDRYFLWYTDPPLWTYMPEDESAVHTGSYFARIQMVLALGGYATSDLG
jgi:hypothetical protein